MGKNFLTTILTINFSNSGNKYPHPDVLAGIGRSMSPLEEMLGNRTPD